MRYAANYHLLASSREHLLKARVLPSKGSLTLLMLLLAGAMLQAQSAAVGRADTRLHLFPETHPQPEILPLAPSAALIDSCAATSGCAESFVSLARSSRPVQQPLHLAEDGTTSSNDPQPSAPPAERHSPPPDFNRTVYYKNKLEFSLDGGWLPINIPFVFDVFLGDAYTMTDLRYTLVPIIASLRWQIDDVGGPWIFRGNWDLQCSGTYTFIPRGPETRYIAWILGVRRNFVPRRGKIAPYFDGRVGMGNIDSKEPLGVLYAQGQDFTFTVNMGAGARYNFSPQYSISAGLNWMHISNLYLSEPQFANYGINVYGPMFGFNIRLGKPRHHPSE